MNLSRLHAAVIVALLLALLPTGAHAADNSDHRLVAASRASGATLGPGDELGIGFEVTHPEDLGYVSMRFVDQIGGSRWVYEWDDGELTTTVDAEWRNGPYTLDYVAVSWYTSNHSIHRIYNRDGSTYTYTGLENTPEAGTHELDLAQLDFSVAGANPDVTVPLLNTVSVQNDRPFKDGERIRLIFDAQDESGLQEAGFEFVDPDGHVRSFWNYADDTIGNVVTARVGRNWMSGDYTLYRVYLYDTTGLVVEYDVDGTVVKDPEGATGPTTHSIDFSTVGFTVDNPDADAAGPQLTDLRALSEHTFFPGETITLEYSATDASDLEEVAFAFVNHESGFSRWSWDEDYSEDGWTGPDGIIKVTLNHWWDSGSWSLEGINLADSLGNMSYYRSDGLVFDGYGPAIPHAFDLSTNDFAITAWPNSFISELDDGTIDIDITSGKFRVLHYEYDNAPVKVAVVESIGNGLYSAKYEDAEVTLNGVFDPSTGRFVAMVNDDWGPTVLGSTQRPQVPLPLP
jgi:hypothetical protein